MSEPQIRCRAAGVELLLPSLGLRHLASAADLELADGMASWEGEPFAVVSLRERFGQVGSVREDDAVALYSIEGENLAVVADRFLGLLAPGDLPSWMVPHLWLLRGGTFPYRRFLAVGELVVAEVSVLGLRVPRRAAEPGGLRSSAEQVTPEGTYLLARIGARRVALLLADLVELVAGTAVFRFPCLPPAVPGFVLHRGRPVPVVRLGADEAATSLAIVRARASTLALALQSTEGLATLASAGIGLEALLNAIARGPAGEESDEPPLPVLADSAWAAI